MQQSERLKICQTCQNRLFKKNIGWVCSITNNIPDFEDVCVNKLDVNIEYRPYNNIKHFDNLYKQMFFERYKRGIHFIIDNAILFVLMYNLSSIIIYLDWAILVEIHLSILFVFCYLMYFSLFEIVLGRTIAHFITNSYVVDENNIKADPTSIMIRTFLRLNPLDFLTFLNPRQAGWHDKFSNTKVINKSRKKQDFDDNLDTFHTGDN